VSLESREDLQPGYELSKRFGRGALPKTVHLSELLHALQYRSRLSVDVVPLGSHLTFLFVLHSGPAQLVLMLNAAASQTEILALCS